MLFAQGQKKHAADAQFDSTVAWPFALMPKGISVSCKLVSRGIAMAIDPVCKMKVDEKKAKFKSEYQGKTYYFCSAQCKTDFDKNPKKYA